MKCWIDLFSPLWFPLQKNCLYFQIVFQRNSVGTPEVNIRNPSVVSMAFYWNFEGIMLTMFSKFTACFPELFWWNTTHSFGQKTNNSWKVFLVFWWNFSVFSRICVVLWWIFAGIFRNYTGQEGNGKGLCWRNLTGILIKFSLRLHCFRNLSL